VFVKKSGECGVVSVDKVMEFSRSAVISRELAISRLNLEILIDLRHLKENVSNGGRAVVK